MKFFYIQYKSYIVKVNLFKKILILPHLKKRKKKCFMSEI